MTTTPTIWKSSFIANSGFTAGSQTVPQTIGLKNGNILVVWEDTLQGPSAGVDVMGRIFDPEGNPVAAPFQVNSAAVASDETGPKIVALPDGGFVMAYGGYFEATGGFIQVQRYNSNGDSLFSNSITDPNSSLTDWEITADVFGDYTVVFERAVQPNPLSQFSIDIHSFTYNYSNNVRGPERTNVAQNTTEDDRLAATAAFANGHVVTFYTEPDYDFAGNKDLTAEFRIIDPATGALIRDVELDDGDPLEDTVAIDVAVLMGGQFVLLYNEHYDGVAFRVVNSETSAVGPQVDVPDQLDANGGRVYRGAHVVAMQDGGFFITWLEQGGILYGQRYGAYGDAIGARFAVAEDVGAFAPSRLSLTSDGRILVSYRNTGGEIAEVILDPRDNIIYGTDTNEFGSGGSDVLTTQTTGTQIFGLGGDDTLLGQSGHDRLDGGLGRDTLDGGGGNEIYVLADVSLLFILFNQAFYGYDAVIEAAGGGDDSVLIRRDTNNPNQIGGYQLTANVENGVIEGAGIFNLDGNEVANRLTGNAAANTLRGFGGADTLDGNGGNDIMEGGAGDDLFVYDLGIGVGGDGADTIMDFLAGAGSDDRIAVTGVHAIRTFGDVLARATQAGADTVFDFGGGDTLTLQNVQKANLTVDDFSGLFATTFQNPALKLASFGADAAAGGWTGNDKYPRTAADVNGDGRADLVGFGDAGVFVALANANGTFQNLIVGINSFGFSAAGGGWSSNNQYPRTLGDVNGDGRADIIGFGDAATFVSLANANGTFQNPIVGINSFGFSAAGGGWSSNDKYPRTVGDVNGDGFADLIGFGDAGAFVALGNANGTFQNPIFALNSFGFSPAGGGWANNNQYPRTAGDVNGDGRADLVGFGDSGVYVALGNANGTFQNPIFALNSFGFSPAGGGWANNNQYPRMLADLNDDGRADLVGFGDTGIFVALGNANGTFSAPIADLASFGPNAGGWSSNNLYPRTVADVNGDGSADVIGFGDAGVFVSNANDFVV